MIFAWVVGGGVHCGTPPIITSAFMYAFFCALCFVICVLVGN